MNPAEYPAAHSMDTDWFAVDADGHVALMHSGEPGPVPVGLEIQRSGWDVLEALALANPSALLERHCEDDEWRHWSLIMLLRDTADLDAIRAAAPKEFKVGMPFTAGANRLVAVSVRRIPEELFARLHREQACFGCTSPFDETHAAPQLGLHVYDASDQYQYGPYERGPLPAHPVQIAALPAFVREFLAAVEFPAVRFRDAAALQPLEHLPCATWGGGEGDQYLASDLKTLRPMPPQGRADE